LLPVNVAFNFADVAATSVAEVFVMAQRDPEF
jgi:hypothetical protein